MAKKSGNRKYVEGKRTGERQTLVHNISLDVLLYACSSTERHMMEDRWTIQ